MEQLYLISGKNKLYNTDLRYKVFDSLETNHYTVSFNFMHHHFKGTIVLQNNKIYKSFLNRITSQTKERIWNELIDKVAREIERYLELF